MKMKYNTECRQTLLKQISTSFKINTNFYNALNFIMFRRRARSIRKEATVIKIIANHHIRVSFIMKQQKCIASYYRLERIHNKTSTRTCIELMNILS